MATIKTTIATNWDVANETKSIFTKYWNYVDSQAAKRTLWFIISLGIHATVFLPLPLLLIGYFNAPIAFLAITMLCFFLNFVANMGGSGIRTTIGLFLMSIVVHLGMVVYVALG